MFFHIQFFDLFCKYNVFDLCTFSLFVSLLCLHIHNDTSYGIFHNIPQFPHILYIFCMFLIPNSVFLYYFSLALFLCFFFLHLSLFLFVLHLVLHSVCWFFHYFQLSILFYLFYYHYLYNLRHLFPCLSFV